MTNIYNYKFINTPVYKSNENVLIDLQLYNRVYLSHTNILYRFDKEFQQYDKMSEWTLLILKLNEVQEESRLMTVNFKKLVK